jgi:branched-chain amino acid aminotransferase
VRIGPWRRAEEAAFPWAAKNISNYAGAYVAALAAKRDGYDTTLLLSPDGLLSEAPTAAVFLVRNGRLVTPRLGDAVLPSITRRVVIEIAAELGLPCEEAPVTRTDAYLADEAFLCGTGIEFGPIGAFDGHALRHATDIPVTRAVIDRYFSRVRDPERAEAVWPAGTGAYA